MYDDFPDFYDCIPESDYRIVCSHGARTVTSVGSNITKPKPGDEIHYSTHQFDTAATQSTSL
jgi:hypothetical protein